MTQTDAGKMLGVGMRTWQNWEYGKRKPRLPQLRRMLELCPDEKLREEFIAASDELAIELAIERAVQKHISEPQARALYAQALRGAETLANAARQGNAAAAEALDRLTEQIMRFAAIAKEGQEREKP